MACTLRYDIGHMVVDAIRDVNIFAFTGLNLHAVSRWAGTGNAPRNCQCFSISLPEQAGDAVRLWQFCDKAESLAKNGTLRNGCRTLKKHLWAALGLAPIWSEAEGGFVDEILEHPCDVASWMAYADWLSEQPGRYDRKRGELIAAWLGPDTIKVKNGILPLLAIEANKLAGIR